MEKFCNAGDNDIKYFIESNATKNKKRSTNNWLNVYNAQARSIGKEAVLKLELIKLNDVLEHIYAKVKTTKGTDYEPDCLKVHACFARSTLKKRVTNINNKIVDNLLNKY